MKTRAGVCHEAGGSWQIEEVDIGEPHAHEVQVEMAYAGLCHSDEHVRRGEMVPAPEIMELLGISSMFPLIGGHEGSGVVTAVGPEVATVEVGDKVATSFIPACGTCFWCASGRQNLCDYGLYTLAGPMISDGSWRHHLGDTPLGRMTQLGTFSEIMVVNEASVVKLAPDAPLRAAALISCGVATGFGSVAERAKARPGEVVVVIGCGGVGSGALQAARLLGAKAVIAVDPLSFKTDQAKKIGATHAASSAQDAVLLVTEVTDGRMADVVVLTPGVLHGELIAAACALGSKDARIVCTAVAPMTHNDVKLNLFNFAMYNQSLLGTVFGSVSPRVQIPRLLGLYASGQLEIDELITREYPLGQLQQGYDDLEAGRNVRGVLKLAGV